MRAGDPFRRWMRDHWRFNIAVLAAVVFVVSAVAFAAGHRDSGGRSVEVTKGAPSSATVPSQQVTTTALPGVVATTVTSAEPSTTTTMAPRTARYGVRVSVDQPETVRADSYVTVFVDVEFGAERNGQVMSIDFGDGTDPGEAAHFEAASPSITSGSNFCSTAVERWVYRHFYRQPGTYIITVKHQTCGLTAPVERATGTVRAVVAERADTAKPETTNGPLPPTAGTYSIPSENSSLEVRGVVDWADRDGFVHDVRIDWGDGSAADVITHPLDGCDDGSGRHFPTSTGSDPAAHTYVSAGSYTVKVTVTSTGCDGGTSQTATSEKVISVTGA